MADTTAITNVTHVDDRAGNHYWIGNVFHTTGTVTDVLVPNSILSASHLSEDGTRGADISITDDDDATDSVREVTIASGTATGSLKIVFRFSGSAAGMGSGHGVL